MNFYFQSQKEKNKQKKHQLCTEVMSLFFFPNFLFFYHTSTPPLIHPAPVGEIQRPLTMPLSKAEGRRVHNTNQEKRKHTPQQHWATTLIQRSLSE